MSAGDPAHEPLGRSTARGATWYAVASLVGKLTTLAMQFVLGWMLVEQDFAVYGAALGATVLTEAIQDGGVHKFLRANQARFLAVIGSATLLAVAGSLLGGLVMVVLAVASPWIYEEGPMQLPLLAMGAYCLLQGPIAVLRARLDVDLRFGAMAVVDTSLVVGRAAAAVALAWAGFGAMSLIAPLVLGAVVEVVAFAAVGGLRRWSMRGARVGDAVVLLRSTIPIMVAQVGSLLARRGDYLVLSLVAPWILGLYYFGFQFSASTMQLVTGAAASVLPSVIGRIAADPARVAATFARVQRFAAWTILPSGVALALVTPALIHLLWGGRWDGAIPIAQAIAYAFAIRGIAIASDMTLEGLGRWRLLLGLSFVEGTSLVAAVLAAEILRPEDLSMLALLVGVQQAVIGIVRLEVAARAVGAGAWRILRWTLLVGAGTAASWAIARGAAPLLGVPAGGILGAAAEVAIFAVAWAAILGVSAWRDLREFAALATSRR